MSKLFVRFFIVCVCFSKLAVAKRHIVKVSDHLRYFLDEVKFLEKQADGRPYRCVPGELLPSYHPCLQCFCSKDGTKQCLTVKNCQSNRNSPSKNYINLDFDKYITEEGSDTSGDSKSAESSSDSSSSSDSECIPGEVIPSFDLCTQCFCGDDGKFNTKFCLTMKECLENIKSPSEEYIDFDFDKHINKDSSDGSVESKSESESITAESSSDSRPSRPSKPSIVKDCVAGQLLPSHDPCIHCFCGKDGTTVHRECIAIHHCPENPYFPSVQSIDIDMDKYLTKDDSGASVDSRPAESSDSS